MILLISFTTNTPDHDYQPLADAITGLGFHCQCFDSTWLLDSTHNSDQAFNVLGGLVGDNDGLLVTEVNVHSAIGRLPNPVIDWLKHQKQLRL